MPELVRKSVTRDNIKRNDQPRNPVSAQRAFLPHFHRLSSSLPPSLLSPLLDAVPDDSPPQLVKFCAAAGDPRAVEHLCGGETLRRVVREERRQERADCARAGSRQRASLPD